MLCFIASSALPTLPRPVYSISVLDYSADPTGALDNTIAFSAALAAAAAQNGGIVLAPAGVYRFDGAFEVPSGVTLRGTFAYAPWNGKGLRNGSHTAPTNGTVFHSMGGAGSEEGAFITLAADAALMGVSVYYPQQRGDQPVPYPWCVRLAGSNAALTDALLLNPWNGVNVTLAPRHYIARVQGQPINIGLAIDQNYDIGRVQDVHWHTGWRWYPGDDFKGGAYLHQLLFGKGFVIARSDWYRTRTLLTPRMLPADQEIMSSHLAAGST